MSPALHHLAARAASDPQFVAYHLLGLDDDLQTAASLHCTLDSLTHIRLCSRPVTMEDAQGIARRFGCDAGALAGACGVRG